MVKVKVYNKTGLKKEKSSLPKNFETKINADLLSQAIRVYEDRKHPGLSKVKTRGEIIRTKKKVYRQKGTGRARHGAKSAPIFVGGGVTHGPKGVKRILSLPRKIRKKALDMALSLKVKDGLVVMVEGIEKIKKTKEGKRVVDLLMKDFEVGKITFVLTKNSIARRFLRNLEDISLKDVENLNVHDVFFGDLIVFDKSIFSKVKKVKKDSKKNVNANKSLKVKKQVKK